jgi:hypothetical protein
MRLQALYADLTELLLAEDVPEDIARIIGNAASQRTIFAKEHFNALMDKILSMLVDETGIPENEAMREIDSFLVNRNNDQWFNTIEKPHPMPKRPKLEPELKEPKPLGPEDIPDPIRPKNEYDWETIWHEVLRDAFQKLNNFRPSDLWGRDIEGFFPDRQYFVFEVGGDDGWYTLAAPQTRNINLNDSGGSGLYMIRKQAHTDIPQFGIRNGESARSWFPKVLAFIAESDLPTEWDSPYFKTFLRNILLKTKLGLQTNRNETENERVQAAFDPDYAENFDVLSHPWVWGADARLESRIPRRLRFWVESLAIARKLAR